MADLLRGGEDRPQDPVADRDPRRVLHADEVLGALVHRDEDRRRRLRDGDDPAGGPLQRDDAAALVAEAIGPAMGAAGARRWHRRGPRPRRPTGPGPAAGEQHRTGREGAAEDGSRAQVAGPRGPAARHGYSDPGSGPEDARKGSSRLPDRRRGGRQGGHLGVERPGSRPRRRSSAGGLPGVRVVVEAEQPGHRAVQRRRQLGELGDVEARTVLEAAQRLVGAEHPEPGQPADDLLLGEAEGPAPFPQALADHEMARRTEVRGAGQRHGRPPKRAFPRSAWFRESVNP